VRKADEIIARGIATVGEEQRSLAAVDLVKEYRRSAESVRQRELERALAAITRGDDPQQVVAQMARAITNKLIHAPTAGLKKASAEGRHDVLGHAARLLGLENAAPAVDEVIVDPDTVGATARAASPAADTTEATPPGRTLQ
jgi:glutamyl-tRNA reductase